jgi:aminomethyltransferase
MSDVLLQTPLHDWHRAHGGRMVEFAGWSMPVQYTSIVQEHQAVRTAAGLFDISHMGRLRVSGPNRVELLQKVTTNDVAALEEGQAQYSLVTNERGGILDDVLVYRFAEYHFVICNASNREKIVGWLERHSSGMSVELDDRTRAWCMIALQGPRAREIMAPLTDADLSRLRYYRAQTAQVLGEWAIVSRTGYTGEEGFEIITASEQAVPLWEALLEQGKSDGLVPAGLGARDTLRLEAAMPLYGHELTKEIDPLQAGLAFAVKLEKGDFVGHDAMVARNSDVARPVRVGLQLAGRRIAREGAAVLREDDEVGKVTSGTFSPTLEKSIAMAYVQPDAAAVGTALAVDVRGRREAATVVKLPFYKRPRKRTGSKGS